MNILLIKEFVADKIVYDNRRKDPKLKKINLGDDFIDVNFWDITNTDIQGGNVDSELHGELKKILHMGPYSGASDGASANFFKIVSKKSGKAYIVYSGVNEVYNSLYVVTIHKIFQLE